MKIEIRIGVVASKQGGSLVNDRYFKQMRSMFVLTSMLLALAGGPSMFAASASPAGSEAFEKRQQMLAAFEREGVNAIPTLEQALDDDTKLVRRTAAHLLVRIGEPAQEAFDTALRNRDVQVRRIVIDGLAEMGLLTAYWPMILMDEHPLIRRDVQLVLLEDHPLPEGEALAVLMDQLSQTYAHAPTSQREHLVEVFASFDVLTEQTRQLLIQATRDDENRVREAAYQGILKHINRDWNQASTLIARAKEDESEAVRDIGRELRWKLLEVERMPLPEEGWRFQTDPDETGREAGWFELDFNDTDWNSDAVIEASWHSFLKSQFIGAAWYRRTIEVPAISEWDAAYLDFRGVDESAWVWVNGQYVGSHDIGPNGWDVPFVLEVTDALEPGQANQVTIRAQNTAGEGGVWQPVYVRVTNSRLIAQ